MQKTIDDKLYGNAYNCVHLYHFQNKKKNTYYYAMGSTIVAASDGPEAFLSSCIPLYEVKKEKQRPLFQLRVWLEQN